MPLVYDLPPTSGPLRQGEILADIWEHRPLQAPIAIDQDDPFEFRPIQHPLMVVMTAVCDLEWDYNARFAHETAEQHGTAGVVAHDQPEVADNDPRLVPHVLLCELYEQNNIRVLIRGSELWKRIRQNQDERYHHLGPGFIGDPPVGQFPDLYLDFKKTIALSTQSLYSESGSVQVPRKAIVPPVYVHDLIQRFYGFLSRVGVPD